MQDYYEKVECEDSWHPRSGGTVLLAGHEPGRGADCG